MLIRKPDDIPSSEITPERVYINRREFIGKSAGIALGGAAGSALIGGGVGGGLVGGPVGRRLRPHRVARRTGAVCAPKWARS